MILLAGILRAEIIGTEERTIPVPVAEIIDAWRASEEGPCVRCSARTRVYGPRGNRLCADCRPPRTEASAIPVPAALTGQEYKRQMPPAAARLTRRGAA